MKMQTTIAAMTIAAASGPAWAGYAIVQGPTAPTYTGKTLNFDEPGGPTGFVTTDAWLASHGLTIDAGDGVPQVDDWATITGQPWIGDANSFYGNFGVFMTFEQDLSALAIEIWDPSGPPGPFGGGLAVYLFDDGVEVASSFVTPAWGGIGDTWFDITADGGDVFDEVRILGWGFSPTTYADNLSWDVVAGAVELPLDIKPGSCPNPLNRGSRGLTPMAVLGTMDYDVSMIDESSIRLARADGVGGEVEPYSANYDDVATPFDGEPCDCHEMGGDGIMDLSLKFRTPDVVSALQLDGMSHGDVVELVVTGTLLDGTAFEAYDCIKTVGRNMNWWMMAPATSPPATNKSVSGNSSD